MQRRTMPAMALMLCLPSAWGVACAGCASPGGRQPDAIETPGSPQRRRQQADRMRRAGQLDEAIAAYSAILEQQIEDRRLDAALHHELSLAYWKRAGRVGGQEAAAETLASDQAAAIQHAGDALGILESMTEDRPAGLYARVGRSLAGYLRGQGRVTEAIDVYRRLLADASEPGLDQVLTLHELGNAYLERGGRRGAGDEPPTAAGREEDSAEALKCQTRALEMAGEIEGCPPMRLASINHSLGLIYSARQQPTEAAERFAEAELVCREHGDSAQHAEVLVNLILALVEAGRFDDVRTRCQELKSLPISASDPRIMTALGLAALKLGDFSEARQRFDLARHLARQDPQYRGDPGFLAELAINAATCAQAIGAYDEAERHLLDAQRELETGGVDPRTTAVVKANLGRMYLTLERLDQAEVQLQAVGQVWREMQGPKHPDTLLLELDLANLARLRGHLVEAEDRCEAAVAGLAEALGENHPKVAAARLELASLYREQSRCAEAMVQAKQALEVLDARLGPNHKQSVIACLQATLIAADCRESDEGAEQQFRVLGSDARKRFATLRAALGPKNVEVLRALVYSAEVSAQTPAAHERALQSYQQAEEGFLELYGDGVLSLAALRLKRGKLLERMGRQDQALRLYDRASRLMDRSLERHPVRAQLLAAMGDILKDQGDLDRARTFWQQAYQILSATYGPDHPLVKAFMEQRSG